MKKLFVTTAFVAAVALTSAAAPAQACGAAAGSSAGMCGMTGQPAQTQSGQSATPGTPMPGRGGMMHGQSQGAQPPQGQGMMQGGMMACPMMNQMAALQERVRRMEDTMKPGTPKQ